MVSLSVKLLKNQKSELKSSSKKQDFTLYTFFIKKKL